MLVCIPWEMSVSLTQRQGCRLRKSVMQSIRDFQRTLSCRIPARWMRVFTRVFQKAGKTLRIPDLEPEIPDAYPQTGYVFLSSCSWMLKKCRMRAQYLVGEHDFKSFCAANAQSQTSIRTIYTCTVTREHDIITIRVQGNGFLYNMVRIIAGTSDQSRMRGMETGGYESNPCCV